MYDFIQDQKLNIKTRGRDYSAMNDYNYGYNPTPYKVLAKIASSGLLSPEDTLIDYGCGKGRTSIFLHEKTGCKVVGIDSDEKRIREAEKNLELYKSVCSKNGTPDGCSIESKIKFIHTKAEDFDPKDGNIFYFFNPFSPKIFEQVLKKISKVKNETKKNMRIIFYYPTDEYEKYFASEKHLTLSGEITCGVFSMWDEDVERVLIFEVD